MNTTKTAKKRGRPPKKVVETPPVALTEEKQDDVVGTFLVLRQCPNPSWVIVRMDGIGAQVRVPRKISHKLVGKPIKVIKVTDGPGEEYYEYQP